MTYFIPARGMIVGRGQLVHEGDGADDTKQIIPKLLQIGIECLRSSSRYYLSTRVHWITEESVLLVLRKQRPKVYTRRHDYALVAGRLMRKGGPAYFTLFGTYATVKQAHAVAQEEVKREHMAREIEVL